ncbi:MAG: 2-oxo acid dehydrogenase subunit E2 [Candidatus Latescibacteria bacterium]|nr:2-oxo acid dehydrogenase subunit E2 [Candidatus Latescibacterota bacterium]
MVKPIVMPKYGLQQDQGTVIRWLKQEGERVKQGEALLELETDKAVFEYASPEAGVLRKIVVGDGTTVPVLSVIAVLTDSADEPFDAGAAGPAPAVATVASEAPPPTPGAAPTAGGGDRIKSSPAAKKLAKDLGVDLAAVKGTGPGGRVTREDVEQAAAGRQAAPTAAPPPIAGRTPLSRMRQAIGRAMSESKRTIPHFYVATEVDMTDAEAWRRRVSSERGIKLSVTDVLVKAAAMTLAKYPALNASLDGDAMVAHGGVHIGLAVGREDGLLVPVIGDVHAKSMTVLAKERAEVVEAARSGKLRGAAQATFTISNLGMFGVTSFIAIVNPPESAALAVGAILPQVRPFGEPLTIAVRQVMQVTLSADHRLADGMLAAQYLQDLKQNLERVETLQGWL